jgi:hypothetical protein
MRTLTFSSSGGECRNPTLRKCVDEDSHSGNGELGVIPRLPELQSSIAKVKTPHIEAFFISLESYRILDVENGLVWPIWASIAQFMAKKGRESNR